jgi:hypothetical protein
MKPDLCASAENQNRHETYYIVRRPIEGLDSGELAGPKVVTFRIVSIMVKSLGPGYRRDRAHFLSKLSKVPRYRALDFWRSVRVSGVHQ